MHVSPRAAGRTRGVYIQDHARVDVGAFSGFVCWGTQGGTSGISRGPREGLLDHTYRRGGAVRNDAKQTTAQILNRQRVAIRLAESPGSAWPAWLSAFGFRAGSVARVRCRECHGIRPRWICTRVMVAGMQCRYACIMRASHFVDGRNTERCLEVPRPAFSVTGPLSPAFAMVAKKWTFR